MERSTVAMLEARGPGSPSGTGCICPPGESAFPAAIRTPDIALVEVVVAGGRRTDQKLAQRVAVAGPERIEARRLQPAAGGAVPRVSFVLLCRTAGVVVHVRGAGKPLRVVGSREERSIPGQPVRWEPPATYGNDCPMMPRSIHGYKSNQTPACERGRQGRTRWRMLGFFSVEQGPPPNNINSR